jgi:hypothetical protein
MKTTETILKTVQTQHGPIQLVQRDAELPGCRVNGGPEFTHCWTDFGCVRPFATRPFGRRDEAEAAFKREVEAFTRLGWMVAEVA